MFSDETCFSFDANTKRQSSAWEASPSATETPVSQISSKNFIGDHFLIGEDTNLFWLRRR